jgi:hypothetical protein
MLRKIAATTGVWLCATLAWAQGASAPPPRPCSAAEHRQFDFWLGRWDVFTPDGRKAGENVIEAAHGGCVLIERWQGGGGLTGTSLNSWDARARVWRQHWVDNQGGLLQLAGGMDGARMVLASEGPHPRKPGVTLRQRIAWTPLADGAVRQLWEQSEDGGATWSTAFDGRYLKARP